MLGCSRNRRATEAPAGVARQAGSPVLQSVGNVLRGLLEATTHEPLPRRWVKLVEDLDQGKQGWPQDRDSHDDFDRFALDK
jgi:hypothetical protein